MSALLPGVIDTLCRDREGHLLGYGFVQQCGRRVQGLRYFFHAVDLQGAEFERLVPGMAVVFEAAEPTAKGLRCAKVVVSPGQGL